MGHPHPNVFLLGDLRKISKAKQINLQCLVAARISITTCLKNIKLPNISQVA